MTTEWTAVTPLVDEPEGLAQWYEPWVPAEGQRVRYVLRTECPGVYGRRYPVGHPPEFDRQLGVMYEEHRCGMQDPSNGHRFLVRLDSGQHITAAALELEPLSP